MYHFTTRLLLEKYVEGMLQSPLEEVDFVDIYIGSSWDLNLYHLSTSKIPSGLEVTTRHPHSVACQGTCTLQATAITKVHLFFFGGNKAPPADRSPSFSAAWEVFWCVVFPPSKNGRNNEQKPPNQGGRPLKNDLKFLHGNFNHPKFEVSQDLALKKQDLGEVSN